jgi:hypothetical protein
MFDSQILDTAIGLVFIYFFLSILCSAIIEIVASLTKKRSRMLGIGILALIQDPKALEKFYQQPFFMGTTVPGNIFQSLWDSIMPLSSLKKRAPSYISSRSFVLSLLESLKHHPDVIAKLLKDRIALPCNENEVKGYIEKVKRLPDESIIKKEMEKVLASAGIDANDVFKKVQEWYTNTISSLVNEDNEETFMQHQPILNEIQISASGNYLNDVRVLVDALPANNSLKKTLLPLLDIAGDNIDKAFDSIEKWYDEGMERVTGWYKKYSQTFGIIMAIVVALVLNADSFEMGKAMYRDKVLRESLVKMASEQVNAESDLNKKIERINKDFGQISNINLPIGWPFKISSIKMIQDNFNLLRPEKILGILITALMISMGSNFWYELLCKLLNVRSAGKKPLTNEEQKSLVKS